MPFSSIKRRVRSSAQDVPTELKPWLLFIIGVGVMALGVTLTTKAYLGTTAISALPYVASLGLKPTMGVFTIILNFILIAVQLLLLGKKFPKIQYLQVPIGFLFGFGIDFWMFVFQSLSPETYIYKLFILVVSTFVLAIGVFMVVRGNIVIMAGEGVVLAVSKRLGKEFGTIKSFFDCTMVALAAILSFVLFGHIEGIREGTVFSAVFVGVIVKYMNRLISPRAPACCNTHDKQ